MGQCQLRGWSVLWPEVSRASFSGAYAVLAYVAQQAVERYQWASTRRDAIGLGMAETTPGPLTDGLCGVRALGAALSAVTAAVVGFIVNLAVWFGIHVIFRDIFVWQGFGFNLIIPVLLRLDIVAAILAIAAAVAIFRIRVGIMHTLLACSLAGVALQLAFGVAS